MQIFLFAFLWPRPVSSLGSSVETQKQKTKQKWDTRKKLMWSTENVLINSIKS